MVSNGDKHCQKCIHSTKSLQHPISVDFFLDKTVFKTVFVSIFLFDKYNYIYHPIPVRKEDIHLKNKLPHSKKNQTPPWSIEVWMIITVYSVLYVLIPLLNIFIDTWDHHITVANVYTQSSNGGRHPPVSTLSNILSLYDSS